MELVTLLKLVQPSLEKRDRVVGHIKRLGKALGFNPDEISSESNDTVLDPRTPFSPQPRNAGPSEGAWR